jgi:NAD(P)-dependent dehydrogenase (short-subunit alcohol dehydrogenase family)
VVVNDLGASLQGEGRDTARAQAVVDEIVAAGGQAVANGDSVSDWDGANRMVTQAVDTFGRIDAVINNAGILRDRFFFNMSPDEWRAVIDVHLNGAFYVSRAAAPHFKDQQGGSYIHMVSTSGLVGNFGQANYAAAKLGISALSKSIAMDMAKFKVRSNCISPFAWSRMISSIPTETDEQRDRVARLQKMETAKIAPLAVFLASDAAADVTGQIFAVRANEIFLMSQSRPLRSLHTEQGWTPQSVADRVIPALRSSFYKLDRSQDVFDWDPV